MISIACTACKKVMTIDDAFAGGVCRCTHCGTIQTVPTHLKGNADAASAPAGPAPAAEPASGSVGVADRKKQHRRPRWRLILGGASLIGGALLAWALLAE